MAQLPDSIVSIMMVDNAGAVVSVPVGDIFKPSQAQAITQAVATATPAQSGQSSVINNTVETTIKLDITADKNYIPVVNLDSNNLINSILFQFEKRIGLNTVLPKYAFDSKEGSINVDSVEGTNGFKINGRNLAYAKSVGNTIYLGDTKYDSINLDKLFISSAIEIPALTYNKLLQVQPDGKVITVPSFTNGSVIFSDGQVLTQDNARFFWDKVNYRLGILTSAPSYPLDVNGVARIQTSIITPVIGNAAGVTANNTWTYTSNVNVPITPTSPTHAASKDYVDNTALTGLKLGASVKTVATTNIGLSGLSAVNGYTPIAGDRILVIGQTTQSANGVYDAASGAWTRSTDSDTDTELRGYQYLITAGTNANYRYGNTNQTTITVGSTAITYQTISAGESDPIFTASPSFGITSTNITNWGAAYNRSAVSLVFSGTSTKTLTLTKQDGTTLSDSFTFPITSVFGRTGDIVLTSSDISTALGYTPYNGTGNPNGYISSITSGQITTALGYTPYNASNPSGYISTVTSSMVTTALGYTPLASYTETDTLASVTARGASTSTAITSTSTISATGGFFESSDIRFKNVLGTNPDIDVSMIDTIKYMRTTYDKDKIRYGYSAQDVYDILPECVNDDGISLSINYTDIHTLKILQLEKRVAELEAKLGI
jgi:hypothetical protein